MAGGAVRRQACPRAEGHRKLLIAWRSSGSREPSATSTKSSSPSPREIPSAAAKVAAHLHHAAARLGPHSRIGRRGRVAGTRELVVPRLPFVIAYRVRPDRIEVARVIHGRRDWRAAFRARA
ncbi:MAG: type II toxin-antitoxin system RelE/ParE family toxin [Candidatus Rokuibacteriota bacterium]